MGTEPITGTSTLRRYVNLDEQEQSAFGLPSSNYERLLDLGQKYDPDDVFRSTIGHLRTHLLTR